VRITVLALGSRGDVQPFIPLGQALDAAGCRVRIATFAAFEPLVKGAGLDFYPLRGDAQALVNAAAQGNLLTQRINPLRTLHALRCSYGMPAAAIREAVSDSDVRRRAAELGRQLRAEDGVGQAVEIISKIPACQEPHDRI